MSTLPPLPRQPRGTPWPTKEWPLGDLPKALDHARFDALMTRGFSDFGETHAVVIIQGGRLVFERYGPEHGPDITCMSWSKAKSITQALAGMLVRDGLLDIEAPADVPEWSAPMEPRRAITLDELLRMSSGLEFAEVYEPDKPSDTIEMLWGSGKADVARYAADKPLIYDPNSFWSYSSGTTNIVSRALSRTIDAFGDDFHAFMRQRLFEPLGMKSPVPKFDPAGTFIGSSFCYATARDFARFGLLYLRDGEWEGRQLLPDYWVDYARIPTWQQEGVVEGKYGAHWWIGIAGPGTFSANGHEGQYTVVVPELDMVFVRHGKTPTPLRDGLKAWVAETIGLFRAP
ncbi:MAG TPA: serine hydrolase [Phenylobacterium sp.]|nr:serine hydrolase [Phenylobacterium sp.]